MNPLTTTADGHQSRHAAVVDALLGVRTDYAGARYDAAVEAALAAHRLDADTARELRWWQRASVQAAQDYAASLVPQVLAAYDRAEAEAARDADSRDASWRQATTVLTRHTPHPSPSRPSIAQTQQAVRAALRSASIDIDRSTGRDERDHAHSASSA